MGQSKFTCGDLLSNVHPLYLEAMIYAVKRVNTLGILNGVTLGGLGIDDCMDGDLSSSFILQVCCVFSYGVCVCVWIEMNGRVNMCV